MGWIFFWPFLDKLLGLKFATETGKGWIDGFSPTTGFLSFATKGPFEEFFKSLAGNPLIDWIFMIGLFGIGISLILGIGIRLASYSGVLMFLLMYVAVLPPEHNPFIDEHIIYAIMLLLLPVLNAGDYLGYGKSWKKSKLVSKFSILK